MKKIITLKSSKSKSLNGIITVPSDKSISIRSLIISSTCLGNTKIFKLLESEDVMNTLQVLKNLKIKIIKNDDYYEIFGQGGFFSDPEKTWTTYHFFAITKFHYVKINYNKTSTNS